MPARVYSSGLFSLGKLTQVSQHLIAVLQAFTD